MRFCPFCSAENADEATHCATCARRLPPLPPRRRKSRSITSPGSPETDAGVPEEPRSALARAVPGPAAHRRQGTAPEVRHGSEPARRSTDEAPGDGGRRTLPPQPSRAERDRLATERSVRPGSARSDPEPPANPPARNQIPRAATPTPIPSGDEDGWPVRRPREPTPDPSDWGADPEVVRRRSAEGTPHPPPDLPPQAGAEDRPGGAAREPTPAPRTSAAAREPTPAPPEPARTAARARRISTPPPTPPPRQSTPAPLPAPPARERTDPAAPPPTRISLPTPRDGAFKPPSVVAVPPVPEPGLLNSARYAVSFARARWQRRSIISDLDNEIREDTAALDGVLGTLGQQARNHRIDNRVLADENGAIDAAEARRARIEQDCAELSNRQADENSKFAETEGDREQKVRESENELEVAQRELSALEAQRRGLRDKRKQIERQQKGYLKAAEERDDQAGKASMGDSRASLRRAAEDLRRDAAGLDPERQEVERKLGALEKPISQALAKVEALKAELDSARRSLNDAREGHRHKLAEIEAEQGRKSRELAQAESEIQRRMVTLGTLVNLHRIDGAEFRDLYESIDRLRGAIGARSTEIDKLTAEREAYDKGSLVRGFVVLSGAAVALVTLVVVLLALL